MGIDWGFALTAAVTVTLTVVFLLLALLATVIALFAAYFWSSDRAAVRRDRTRARQRDKGDLINSER